jgi:hypothetical protein
MAMGDVINLNKYRKQRERAAQKLKAEANRLKHGESKSSRTLRDKKRTLEDKQLEGHKLEGQTLEGQTLEDQKLEE